MKTSMNNPLVTVNILSYNRKDELRNTLTKVYEQDYKNIEVILVDNASTDGTPEMVEKEFPNVKLIKLNKNIGIAGWNKGFEAAKGEYVLVLDDDSYTENGAVSEALRMFEKDNKIGVVAFTVYNSTFDFYETNGWSGELFAFVGCGALIDKKKIDEVGYFDENIFLYLHELEFTARFWDAGFKTLFCEKCRAIHSQSLKARGNEKNPFAGKYRYKHFFRSMSFFLLTKFSFPQCCFVFTKWALNRLIIAVRYFYFRTFLTEFFRVLFSFPNYLKNRKVLKRHTQNFYRYGNVFALVDRDYFPNFKRESE